MLTDWHAFLENRGAEFNQGTIIHYGNPTQELSVVLTGNILCDLSHYSLLAISGDDVKSFLHTQFINDIDNLDESHSHLNGYCNPKGRLIADFRVFWRAGKIYLRLPTKLTEAVNKKLTMYKMRAKVTIEDQTNELIRLGYSGSTAATTLEDVMQIGPMAENEVVQHDGLTILRVPGITPSFELYGKADIMMALWTRLDVHAAPVGTPAWQLIEILAGLPHLTLESMEQYVPQMLNYQAIDGLSFTKGCYPGQEIVARMHFLGKLKKRMYLARVQSDEPPVEHQTLVSNLTNSGTKTGNIVNVAQHPDGDYVILAVIQIADAEETEIHLSNLSSPKLQIIDLPYQVELKNTPP